MQLESHKCLVINHYDGSTVEAYRLTYGDSSDFEINGDWSKFFKID